MITAPDEFRRWFTYEQDAHAKLLDSLRRAEPDHRENPDFATAVDLAAHIATCRTMLLSRIRNSPARPETLFPSGVALAEVARTFDRMHVDWSRYLQTIDEAELERCVEYISYEGVRGRDSVNNVLVQLFGHSLYHQGQIALLLRRVGSTPAVTDFIFWTRQQVCE